MTDGTQLGPYRVGRLLGKGGMAEVYEAWHEGLQHYHALKILPSHLTGDRKLIERFIGEARKMARLQHPNIATVHTVSDADAPQPYFAMELVESGDLSELLEHNRSLSLEATLPFLRQIGAALDYAHSQGLIHRDVKPGNVLLKADGNGGYLVKMVDFGIARAQEENDGKRLTKTGMIVGTPEYMSPEQGGSGAPVDHRTDVYAFGVIAYEMLCGRPPFQGNSDTSMISIIMQHVRDAPRPPREYAPHLSETVNAAILKALAKNPEERFPSCAAFIDALTRVGIGKMQRPKVSLLPVALGVAAVMGVGLIGLALSRPGVIPPSPGETQIASPNGNDGPIAGDVVAPPVAEKVSVPDLVGKDEAQARTILQAKSLAIDVAKEHNSTFAAHQVMRQHPAVGSMVNPGTPVRIRISLGPDFAAQQQQAQLAATQQNESVEREAVFQTLTSWENAWESQNVDAYMGNYAWDARIFSNRKWYSYSQYYDHERKLFSSGGRIEITRYATSVTFVNNRATVSFPMTFQRWGGKGNYKSNGRQNFRMRKEGGRWIIEEDRFQK